MKRETEQEAIQRRCATRGKVGTESITSNVFSCQQLESLGNTHSLFARERRNGTGGKVSRKRIVQINKISKSPSDLGIFALKCWQRGL